MAVAALTALASGCGGQSKPATTPARAEPRVSMVRVRGATLLKPTDILAGLATRAPSGLIRTSYYRFDPLQAELDRKRIESYYEGRGFFAARVTDVKLKRFTDPMSGPLVEVVFAVEEGPRTSIKGIHTVGTPGDLRAQVDQIIEGADVRVGGPIVYWRYSVAKTRIKALLVRNGYAFARVRGAVKVDRPRARAVVDFEIDAGPLARFGRVTVLGLRDIPDSAVRARVAWQSGDVFDPKLLEETQTRLFAMAAFSVIRIEYGQTHAGDRAEVTIRVTETFRREIKFGGGGGVDNTGYEIRARAGHVRRGFLHPLATLRLDLRPAIVFREGVSGTFGGEATSAVDRRDFLYPRALLSAELSYLVSSFDAYSIHGPRFRLAVQRPFVNDRLHLSFGWQFRLREFFDIDSAITAPEQLRLDLKSPYRLGFYEQTIAYDGRDDPVNPRKGFYAELRLEQAGSWAGSEFSYTRAIPELRGFVPLGSRIIAAARARYGRLLSGRLPITQRFASGGASSQRGFSQRRLAPFVVEVVDDGNGESHQRQVSVGGQATVESSFELRADVKRLFGNWLGVVGFLDGADVTETNAELDLSNLHWAAGAGLRYRTPIGAVRLDFGFRLNRTEPTDPDPTDTWAFHFSLGEAF
jgi:translocation and assembly module TamA